MVGTDMDSNSAMNGDTEALKGGCAEEEEEEEEEVVVNINEYVEGLEAQELEVDMILGGDEGEECTYPGGYLARQAVFSCITCCPDGNAGVCTACSLKCHDEHEVIELWTRRHFRCDCGNSKFGIGACKLFSSKDLLNGENVYNKNYKGVYCLCNRPYPDPDATEDMGEMLQCCVCEDWFHEAHLGLSPATEEVPRDEEGEPTFDELICQVCAASLDFLANYRSLMVPVDKSNSSCKEKKPKDTVVEAAALLSSDGTAEVRVEVSAENLAIQDAAQFSDSKSVIETRTSQSEELHHLTKADSNLNEAGIIPSNVICQSERVVTKACKIFSGVASGSVSNGASSDLSSSTALQNGLLGAWTNKALFLTKNWRLQLCRCDSCLALYSDKGVSFLLDSEDTITKYEEIANEKRKEKLNASSSQDLSFLDGLSHVGKIEFLHGVDEMASELSTFLASRDSKTPITSADIYEVFEKLKKKRARLE